LAPVANSRGFILVLHQHRKAADRQGEARPSAAWEQRFQSVQQGLSDSDLQEKITAFAAGPAGVPLSLQADLLIVLQASRDLHDQFFVVLAVVIGIGAATGRKLRGQTDGIMDIGTFLRDFDLKKSFQDVPDPTAGHSGKKRRLSAFARSCRKVENKCPRFAAGVDAAQWTFCLSVELAKDLIEPPDAISFCHFFEYLVNVRPSEDIPIRMRLTKSFRGGVAKSMTQPIILAALLGVG
jgi:hypothetical protein